jgi:hypothetical protein
MSLDEGKSTAMSTTTSRIGSGDPTKPRAPVKTSKQEGGAPYELSLKAATKKPQKLKPLKNMAVTLLENDRPLLEGLPTSAELDRDAKDYLDTNKIFKQLKSAFQP